MAEQSRLEQEGLELRKETLLNLNYTEGEDTEYSANHKDALSTGDPNGKGSGQAMGYTTVSEARKKTRKDGIRYSNVVTRENDSHTIGGDYDINGYGALRGKSGRKANELRNYYSPENEYGLNSVDTTQNVLDGQIVIAGKK